MRGAIMVGGQKIQVGLAHARKTAEITVESDTYQITVGDGIALSAPRTTSRDINGTRLPATQTTAGTMASTRPEGAPLARRTCWRAAPGPRSTARQPGAS